MLMICEIFIDLIDWADHRKQANPFWQASYKVDEAFMTNVCLQSVETSAPGANYSTVTFHQVTDASG